VNHGGVIVCQMVLWPGLGAEGSYRASCWFDFEEGLVKPFSAS